MYITPQLENLYLPFQERSQSIQCSQYQFQLFVQYLLPMKIQTFKSGCSNLSKEFSWSVFFHIWTEYKYLQSISLYSVQMQENTDLKNNILGHFSHGLRVL